MSVEYNGNENDPRVIVRENMRRNPASIREIFAEEKKLNLELTIREFLYDLGFDDTEIANLLSKI